MIRNPQAWAVAFRSWASTGLPPALSNSAMREIADYLECTGRVHEQLSKPDWEPDDLDEIGHHLADAGLHVQRKEAPRGTVISGTHSVRHLLPALLDLLEKLVPDGGWGEALPHGVAENFEDLWWDDEEASHLLDEVFDALNETAPFGHYFGAHPNDGADFGFWENRDD